MALPEAIVYLIDPLLYLHLASHCCKLPHYFKHSHDKYRLCLQGLTIGEIAGFFLITCLTTA